MARLYVGNLPMDIRSKDVEDLFWKYGKIRDVDLKSPARPPAFAFVTFEHQQDAVDAVRGRDGVLFEGQRLRVEMSRQSAEATGYTGHGAPPPMQSSRATPRDLRRSDHRIIISGLPSSASWQDVKDYFRACGDIIYADVDKRGGGIVEFSSRSDQERAIEKMDDSEFKNPFEKSSIRVKKPREQMSEDELEKEREREKRGDGRDKRDKRSRSRSRSRDRRSKSRSRSHGRRNKGGRSRSHSRSRSSSRGRRGKGGD
jgi:arginine/serine-rich splicing factor 1/9